MHCEDLPSSFLVSDLQMVLEQNKIAKNWISLTPKLPMYHFYFQLSHLGKLQSLYGFVQRVKKIYRFLYIS